jgi:carboxymethylenebutenolidase
MVGFGSDGERAEGYLARPAGGKGPAVLVIQEWWGLVDHIKAVADRLADEGFVALAPDLYRGESTASPDEAGRLMLALNIDRAVRDLVGAVDYLLGLDAVSSRSVGVVGFCMGGQLALALGCATERVGAVIDFYGVHPKVKLEWPRLHAPVLGLFGERDAFVTPAVAKRLAEEIRAAGKQIELEIYRGADHAFFNDTGPRYDADAAAAAYRRVLGWFGRFVADEG